MLLLVLLAAAAVLAACATVADLDVSYDRGPPARDFDESDADGAGEGAPPVDGSVRDGGADRPDGPAIFSACSCPVEQGCCVPAAGPGVCTDTAAAAACTASNSVFLRCSAGDLGNGRACCLASDTRSSFFAASCADAGAQLCANDGECPTGACQSIACRSVVLGVCAPEGGALPVCAP